MQAVGEEERRPSEESRITPKRLTEAQECTRMAEIDCCTRECTGHLLSFRRGVCLAVMRARLSHLPHFPHGCTNIARILLLQKPSGKGSFPISFRPEDGRSIASTINSWYGVGWKPEIDLGLLCRHGAFHSVEQLEQLALRDETQNVPQTLEPVNDYYCTSFHYHVSFVCVRRSQSALTRLAMLGCNFLPSYFIYSLP